VCILLTGKRQSQSTDDERVAEADETGVVVCEEDFYSALSCLVPSLSAADLKRYDTLQEMFTLRRHGNHSAQQQQQPVTVSIPADL